MGRQFLAVDVGTTSLKAAVLDLESLVVRHSVRVPTPKYLTGLVGTRRELEPLQIIAEVRRLLCQCLRAAPAANGLVVCSQMHSLVFADEHGNARSNVVTWEDQRATELSAGRTRSLFEELMTQVNAEERCEIGGELRIGVPITTLAALKTEGELPAGVFATSLPGLLIANLCGVTPSADRTNAAAHGLYLLDRGDWHRDLISKLGYDQLLWPQVLEFRDEVGIAVIDGHRLRCFAPVGDQQCALVGVGLSERELSINVSTGSQVSLVSRERPRGDFLVRPYFDGKWLRTIVSVPAGRSLGMLANVLTEMGGRDPDPWEYVRTAVDRIVETDLEVDLSFFASFSSDCGRIGNINERNLTVGHLFLAAFRSMAANYAKCASLLSQDRSWDRVVFSGGLVRRFPRLRHEILAALGNPPARVCAMEEETLRGLLVLALVCDRRAASVEEASRLLTNDS